MRTRPLIVGLTGVIVSLACAQGAPCVFPDIVPDVPVPRYAVRSAADVRRILTGCPIDGPGFETHYVMIALNGHVAVPYVRRVAEQKTDDGCQRNHAIRTLGYFRSPKATEALIRIIASDTAPRIRAVASEALRPAPFESACRFARQLVQTDTTAYVVYNALLTITSCGGPSDTALLSAALERLPPTYHSSLRLSMPRLTLSDARRHAWGRFGGPPAAGGYFVPSAEVIEALRGVAPVTRSRCTVSPRHRVPPVLY